MQKAKVLWDYFMATGNIGAYLIFCELERQGVNVLCSLQKYNHFNGVDG